MDSAVLAALAAGGVAGAGGLLVPRLIARIPEPAAELDSAVDPSLAPRHADEVVEGVTGRKELYRDIAALPGLWWRAAVVAAVVGALVGGVVGWSWAAVPLVFLVPVGVALALIDWRTRLLPTRVIAPSYAVVAGLVLLGWAVSGDHDDVVRAAWGWLGAGGLFLLLWLIHPRGMGYGDVRLAGVLGIALGQLGWGPLVVGTYAGFLLGGVGGLVLAMLRIIERRALPFGPFMLIGALLGVLVGEPLWDGLASGVG
ncbi:prepilin peptidase [Nocardioides pacificus]